MIPENGGGRHAYEQVDVFKKEGAGVLWLGSFSNVEAAKLRINELLISDPGEYFTFNQSTEHKVFFKPNGHNGNNHNGNNDTR